MRFFVMGGGKVVMYFWKVPKDAKSFLLDPVEVVLKCLTKSASKYG